MTDQEHYKHFSFCIKNDIKIYPKVLLPGKLVIVVCKNGKERIGTEIYQEVVTKTKKERKVTVPGLDEKIRELYKSYYDKYSKSNI